MTSVDWEQLTTDLCANLESASISELQRIAEGLDVDASGNKNQICARLAEYFRPISTDPPSLLTSVINQPTVEKLATAVHESLPTEEESVVDINFMDLLPPEIVPEVLASLPQKDLVAMRRVSKRYHSQAIDEQNRRLTAFLKSNPKATEFARAYALVGQYVLQIGVLNAGEKMQSSFLIEIAKEQLSTIVEEVKDAAYYLPVDVWLAAIAEYLSEDVPPLFEAQNHFVRGDAGIAKLVRVLAPFYGLSALLCKPANFTRAPLADVTKPSQLPENLYQWARQLAVRMPEREMPLWQLVKNASIDCLKETVVSSATATV